MSTREELPYDFSPIDDMYLSADNYNDIVGFMLEKMTELYDKAWGDSDAQMPEDVDAYLTKYVHATWRTLELGYIQEADISRARVSSFRNAAIGLKTLLDGEGVDEDFLAIVASYQRDVFLQKVSEASTPWLEKYDVKLEYNSEVQFGYSDWKIVILPITKST